MTGPEILVLVWGGLRWIIPAAIFVYVVFLLWHVLGAIAALPDEIGDVRKAIEEQTQALKDIGAEIRQMRIDSRDPLD